MDIKELKKLIKPVLFAAGIAAVGLIVLMRTTSVSTVYCGICHFKEKEFFKTSFAHNLKNSSCAACHDTWDLGLSKHFSSEHDFLNRKCEECHASVKSAKEIKGRKIVKMDHLAHMDGKKTNMKCIECHAAVAHDRSSYATNRPSMTGCFAGECHIKEKDLKKCDYCHYAKLIFPGNKEQ